MAEPRKSGQALSLLPDEAPRCRAVADGDWRRFRELRARARQRFAEETLTSTLTIALDEDRDVVAREMAVASFLRRRERERRALFEDFNRAHLPLMLHVMVNQGLLRRDELTGLSLELSRALGLID